MTLKNLNGHSSLSKPLNQYHFFIVCRECLNKKIKINLNSIVYLLRWQQILDYNFICRNGIERLLEAMAVTCDKKVLKSRNKMITTPREALPISNLVCSCEYRHY